MITRMYYVLKLTECGRQRRSDMIVLLDQQQISPVILKSCAFELAPSISFLVNKSFLLGHLPEDWRSADIVPLHKKGSKHLRENYRPISLTSMICKISEKIVRDRLTSFWQDQNVINKNQFGFLQGRSTVTKTLYCPN